MNEIFYSLYYHSPIGLLKIVGTENYISEISFFDRVQKTDSKIRKHPPLLIHCVEQLIQYFNGECRQFKLPLNQSGSQFQQNVWNTLLSIPFGKTVTYLEIAKKIGDAKAVRAVGAANGKNNIAIIIPCHRVIGSKHELIGYAGGLWRKKWLLEHEAKFAHGVQQLF